MLQAPTGIGKTLFATEVVARFSSLDNVVWLWFAPYATLIGQAANTRSQRAKRIIFIAEIQISYAPHSDEIIGNQGGPTPNPQTKTAQNPVPQNHTRLACTLG